MFRISVGTELATLPHSPRGNPLLLGDLDTKVQDWIRKVRINGGVINARIVMAAAEAIVTKFARHRLERYGGHITITSTFAKSLLRRMGFVKRKGTKAVKHLPNDFDDIRQEYISKINNVREKHNIPDTLITTGTRQVVSLYQAATGPWRKRVRNRLAFQA